MSSAEILRAAAELVEMGWCQHRHARTADGTPCKYDDRSAVSWCPMGAIDFVGAYIGDLNTALCAYGVLRRMVGAPGIPDWNDAPERTQTEVVAALLAAAEKEDGRE